jgi:hypothetical protein
MKPPPENPRRWQYSSRDVLTSADRLVEMASGICDVVVIIRTPGSITIRDNSGQTGLTGEETLQATNALIGRLFP